MKKKIFITIAIVVAIILIGIGYFIFKDLKQEEMLRAELEEISVLVNEESPDVDKIKTKLNTTVTTGDYAIVEKAFKQYLTDSFSNIIEMVNVLEDKKLTKSLTVENYKSDGPDFVETKKYIAETKAKLEQCKKDYNEYLTEEKAMSYVNGKDLDSYYMELYKNEIVGNIEEEQKDKTVENSINDIIELLNNSEEVINFLVKNKGNWKIEGENILFASQKLIDEYNSLLGKITEE